LRAKNIGKLGTGITSVLFISRFMTANAMFTSAQVTITYNLLAGLLFGFIAALAFLTFGFIGKKVRDQLVKGESINTLLRSRMKEQNIKRFLLIVGIGYALDFLLLAIGASIILYAGFRIPVALGVLLFISIGLPLAFFRSIKYIGNYNIYKIGLFFLIVIIMFVYLFLTMDLEAMYFGMRLYHPYLFTLQSTELFQFSIVVFLIFLGRIVIDIGSWNLLFRIKRGKIKQSFILAGFIWATIPLSFSVIIFPALYQGGFQNLHTIFYDLLHIFQSSVFQFACTIILFFTLVTTYYTKLHEFLLFFEKEFNNTKKVSKLFLTLSVLGVLFIGFIIFQPSVLELFFLIGILHTSLILPMLVILFVNNKNLGNQLPLIVLLTTLLGFTLMQFYSQLVSILITFFASCVLVSITYFFVRLFSERSLFLKTRK
jgi:hypothetical protein